MHIKICHKIMLERNPGNNKKTTTTKTVIKREAGPLPGPNI